jgi:hypothetical protein
MVLPLGFEPRSSPHLEASPGYKPGALTVMLWEQNLERVARIELANIPWQGIRLPLHHTRMEQILFYKLCYSGIFHPVNPRMPSEKVSHSLFFRIVFIF